VLAYDFKTGKRIWEATIADVKLGEMVPSAPIASDGLVFVRNAGGDTKHVIRGGSFLCSEAFCFSYRPAARMKLSPDTALPNVGFRLVKAL
jgi:formylglycine-generating enzyme required for sulfatase activity